MFITRTLLQEVRDTDRFYKRFRMYHILLCLLTNTNCIWGHNREKKHCIKISFFLSLRSTKYQQNIWLIIIITETAMMSDIAIYLTLLLWKRALLSFGSVASPIVVGSINYSNTITSCQWLKGVIKRLQVLKNSAFANQYSRLEPAKIYTWPTKIRKQFCTTSIFIRPWLVGRDNGSLSRDLWVNSRLKIQKL